MASGDNITAGSGDLLERTKLEIGLKLLFSLIIFVAAILGNILIVVVVKKDSQLKNITNIFIQNLACVDFFRGLLSMPFWIISLYTGHWIFSAKLCEWTAVVKIAYSTASIFNMTLIAVNRYLKVVKTNRYRKFFPSKKSAHVYCLAIWLAAVVLSTTPLYGWGRMAYNQDMYLCTLVWEMKQISQLCVVMVAVAIIPTVLIFFCYYKIYRKVKTSSVNVRSHGTQNNATQNSHVCQTTDVKLLKSTFVVVCVHLLCWVPGTLILLHLTTFGDTPRLVSCSMGYLTLISSAINPIIYGVLNPQFKRAFAKVLKCKKTDHQAGLELGVQINTQTPVS